MSDDLFALNEDTVFELYGKPAVYSRGNVDTAVRVIVEYDLTRWGETINVSNVSAMATVRESEVPLKPKRGDLFTLETGKVLRVESTPIYDGRLWSSLVTV